MPEEASETQAASDFSSRLARVGEAVTSLQSEILSSHRGLGLERLIDAMSHGLHGGKHFRGFLAVASARLFSSSPLGALRAAAAVEFMHAYSLIHDDLPAMDDDAMRRGRPTVHVAYDEATAILAGDALQALAFEVLADAATHGDAAIRAALVFALSRACGVAGMVGGQAMDMEASGRRASPAWTDRLQRLKTGALLRFCCESGAILAAADRGSRAALAAYGEALGLMFQIVDDLLDIEGEAVHLGKATGKDARLGKATYPGVFGVEAARNKTAELLRDALAALDRWGAEADDLRMAARFCATRQR